MFLRSRDRTSGSTTDATFNISPPIDRGKVWKIQEWQGQALVGPRNDTVIEVALDWTGAWDPANSAKTTYRASVYPSLGPIVQKQSLYDDYLGQTSTAANFTPANLADIGYAQPTPTPAPFLYTQLALPGFVESNAAGAAPPSAQTQLAMALELAIRKVIAQAVFSYCGGANIYPQVDPDNGRAGYRVLPRLSPGASASFLYGTISYVAKDFLFFDTWYPDVASMFHVVPPGATVTHLSQSFAAAPPADGVQPAAPAADAPLVPGTRYTFTNTSSRYAFVFLYDDAFNASNNTSTGTTQLPPWVTALSFIIHGEMARVFGLEPGVEVAVQGMRPRDPGYTPGYGAPRWPLRGTPNILGASGDHYPNLWTNVPQNVTVPSYLATFAPASVVYQTPRLDVYCSMLRNHQTITSSAQGGLTTLCLQIPLGGDASALIQYQNNSSDFSNSNNQEIIGQFSIRLALDTGEEINSPNTLPPGVDAATAEGALFVDFPEWVMQLAFGDV